jgi:hypothetical protein
MASRNDIQPDADGWRRLSYTCRCGWIDWGHALPRGAELLKRQIDTELTNWPELGQLNVTLNGSPAYVVNYGQEMGRGPIRFSTTRHWVVRKGLPLDVRRSVALGIFLNASYEFESLQGSFPFTVVSRGRSSFSIEDLISNLVGFYAAFNSISLARMRLICGEVSVSESFRIWDEHLADGLGALRNRGLTPIKFPCPECDATQSDASFPSLFSSISTAPPGALWVRVKHRFIDGRLVNAGRALQVSSDGDVSARTR